MIYSILCVICGLTAKRSLINCRTCTSDFHLRSSFFTIHSHSLNFNATAAFLPRPCPRCSSKSEATISVLSIYKVKKRLFQSSAITPA